MRTDPTTPPTPEELASHAGFPGAGDLRLDLAGLTLELRGLPAPLRDRMQPRYGPFLAAPGGGPRADLTVSVRDAGREHFIPPAAEPTNRRYRLSIVPHEAALRMVGHGFAGWIEPGTGRGCVSLCHGAFDPPERALENFVRVGVAWASLERGGFLLHSASIVRDGLAYLFFGASGAGKSTLAAMNREGAVVSDDLTVVLPGEDGRLFVAGSPFRGTYTGGDPVTGRFPIHSAYRLRQDTSTRVERPPTPIALADLIANLTFVVDQLGRVPGLAERIEPRLRQVPTYHLHFQKRPDFWRAIEEFHAGS